MTCDWPAVLPLPFLCSHPFAVSNDILLYAALCCAFVQEYIYLESSPVLQTNTVPYLFNPRFGTRGSNNLGVGTLQRIRFNYISIPNQLRQPTSESQFFITFGYPTIINTGCSQQFRRSDSRYTTPLFMKTSFFHIMALYPVYLTMSSFVLVYKTLLPLYSKNSFKEKNMC